MLVRYIRDKGEIVATIVAVAKNKVGVSFVHKNDKRFKRVKVDKVDNHNVYQYEGFRKHVGIELAAERAYDQNLPAVPKRKIQPRLNDSARYPLDEVVYTEFNKMVDRSRSYYV